MGKAIKIRSIFDPSEDEGIDFRVADPKTGEFKFHPGRTKQSDKDSCDINLILKRYESTGILPDLIRAEPRYGDFSDVPSYQEACDIVERANTQFEALEARVRDRFNNDPRQMLAFCANPANKAEMVAMGLALPPPAGPAVNVEQTAQPTPAAPVPKA